MSKSSIFLLLTIGVFLIVETSYCDQHTIPYSIGDLSESRDAGWHTPVEIACLIDTSKRDRDRRSPPSEETKTVRVPKAGQRAGQKGEDKSSDGSSFWDFLSCLSGCADVLNIFSSGEETTPVENQVPIEFVEDEKSKRDSLSIFEVEEIRERAKNSFWYLGAELGIGETISSREKPEYELGWMPRITAGIFLLHNIQIEGFAEYGWYAGKPRYDYVTTTNLNSSDIEKVKEIPQKSCLSFSTFGIGARYVIIFNPSDVEEIDCLGIGGEFRYMSFYEKADLNREEYLNEVQLKNFKHTISQHFNRPAWAVSVSYIHLPSYLPGWMFEIGMWYNGINKKPTEKMPLSAEWDGLTGQVVFKIGINFNIYEIK